MIKKIVLAITLPVTGAVLTAGALLWGSLPNLDGKVLVDSGLNQNVTIERDIRGMVTINASSKLDAAYALGYCHGQDRFFQMDLSRRMAAGELSALVGPKAISVDKRMRIHRMRTRIQKMVGNMSTSQLEHLSRYRQGVNKGLQDLSVRPFEYLLLNQQPKPWTEVDTFLVGVSMMADMTSSLVKHDYARELLNRLGGEALISFIQPHGSQWDTAIDQSLESGAQLPPGELFSLRDSVNSESIASASDDLMPMMLGSNSWAVSGKHTSHGSALFSNDPHLKLRMPHIWYRTHINYSTDPSKPDSERIQLTGVSLPGMPTIAIGTNHHVAWGMTNSAGDWADYIRLDIESDSYLTSSGKKLIQRHKEIIMVKGQEPIELIVEDTQFGPIVDLPSGERVAYRWLMHFDEAINALPLLQFDSVKTVAEMKPIANQAGITPFNLISADRDGDIMWTIVGRIPNRIGSDTTRFVDWRIAEKDWQGFLEPANYPVLEGKQYSKMWTANNRVVGGDMLDAIGHLSYELGARGWLIEQDIKQQEQFNEADFSRMLQNNKAVVVAPWQSHLVTLLELQEGLNDNQQTALDHLKKWSGRASINDVGYTIARHYQKAFHASVNKSLNQALIERDILPKDLETINLLNRQSEVAMGILRDQKPLHFLPKVYATWEQWQINILDSVLSDLEHTYGSIAQATWGQANRLQMKHPLSSVMPEFIRNFLDMPATPLSGDANMPLAQRSNTGQSLRFIVSPGHEEDGYLVIPGGQSGNPLSAFYSAGHTDWVKDKRTPLLPGKSLHKLTLAVP